MFVFFGKKPIRGLVSYTHINVLPSYMEKHKHDFKWNRKTNCLTIGKTVSICFINYSVLFLL